MAYLVLPQTQGARLLYQDYVDPFLTHHEREIEDMIGSTHEKAKAMGLQYFYQAIELIRVKVLGLPPQRPATPPQPGAASYAQSLLSRFNIPTARASGVPGASTTSNDWFSVLGAAVGSVAATGKSREVREEQLSASGNLLQRQMQSMSGTEKAQFISSQRELLDYLRSTLAREEQSHTRGELDPDDLAYGLPLRKNRSENSFEVVDDEDLGRRPERQAGGGGGWSSGWFSNGQESSGSSGADFAARAIDEITRSRATGYDRS